MKSIAGLLLCFVTSIAFAKPAPPPESNPMGLLNAVELRKLQPEKRREYLMLLQEFVAKLAEQDPAESALDRFTPSATWTALLSSIEEARAAANCTDGMFAVQSKNNPRFCVKGGYVGQEDSAWVCDDDAGLQRVATECRKEFSEFGAAPKFVSGNALDGATRKAATEKAHDIQRTFKENPPPKAEAAPDKPAKDQVAISKDPLRCIYAGFPRPGKEKKDCTPVSEWDKFKCPHSGGKSSSENVLCNPVLFGTIKSGDAEDGICVSKGKNATRDCLKKSQATEGALQRAQKLGESHQNDFIELNRGIVKLCERGNSLGKEHLDSMGKNLNESSRNDLQRTCSHYETALNRLAHGDSGGSGGSATGGTR